MNILLIYQITGSFAESHDVLFKLFFLGGRRSLSSHAEKKRPNAVVEHLREFRHVRICAPTSSWVTGVY